MNKVKLTRPSDGLIKNNPIFINMIAVTAAVIATNTLVGAAVYSAVFVCVLVLSGAVSYPILRGVNTGFFRAVHMVICAGVVSVAEICILRIFPSLHNDNPFYIPLIIISATLIFETCRRDSFFLSVGGSFFSGIGYTLALVSIAAFRELLSTGRLFSFCGSEGIVVFKEWFTPLSVLSSPAGGLIFAGVCIALVRKISNSLKEAEERRAAELDKIKRGEHETLVFDEELGTVVLRRTVMKRELESSLKPSEEQTDPLSFDDEFEFESDEPVTFGEDDEEDTDFEDYDYE